MPEDKRLGGVTETELTTSTLERSGCPGREGGATASSVPHCPQDVHFPVRVTVENPQWLQT
jgi:hypothetical protein